jgi:hypothetical protein
MRSRLFYKPTLIISSAAGQIPRRTYHCYGSQRCLHRCFATSTRAVILVALQSFPPTLPIASQLQHRERGSAQQAYYGDELCYKSFGRLEESAPENLFLPFCRIRSSRVCPTLYGKTDAPRQICTTNCTLAILMACIILQAPKQDVCCIALGTGVVPTASEHLERRCSVVMHSCQLPAWIGNPGMHALG